MPRPQRGQRKNYAADQDAESEGDNSKGDDAPSSRPRRLTARPVNHAEDSDDASNQMSEEVDKALELTL
jgi:hypothetical protein